MTIPRCPLLTRNSQTRMLPWRSSAAKLINERQDGQLTLRARDTYEPTYFPRPQCIGYMGVVHRRRKEAKKENCEVFGFVTDGYDFCFMKIDEFSRLYKTRIPVIYFRYNGNCVPGGANQ
ncbi:uncharacterized protein BJX67DRAFT_364382 [Aspergillus lucknowensis]|uniref:Uncharacterized protein n=1 Tax=Aspergillus lucknowensis TaxID=176173 RepID=A0ABR4LIB2_9EURO